MNVTVTVDLNGVPEALEAAGDRAVEQALVAQRNAALRLQTAVRRNASTGYHRPGQPHIPGTGPGPNVATGDYRRSIRAVATGDGWVVSTNSPQAARLEFGFVGRDALGRYFHQPAYPHWGPAVDEVEPRLVADLEAVADRLVGSLTTRVGEG